MFSLIEPFQVNCSVHFTQGINIPVDVLPRQYIDGKVRAKDALRCSIKYGQKMTGGGYGHITKIERTPLVGTELCVKSPHNSAFSLTPEAILQWHASQTLRSAGIMGAIPHVYDIFQFVGETRFTMDYIRGKSAVEAVGTAENPDAMWLQILAQVSLILGYLEEHIRLDHRDLKADNLWIRPIPIDYSITVGAKKWRLRAPFQVVVLDFGFACLGNEEGNAIVSLSDGIVPKIDPCPKEGRDLFQLIASMWSIPAIRYKASKEVNEAMEKLLAHKKSSYIDIVTQNLQTHWIYLAVSDSRFRHPPLHPVSLLLKLSNDWKEVGLYQE
jgi:serine/threonine protein kinase